MRNHLLPFLGLSCGTLVAGLTCDGDVTITNNSERLDLLNCPSWNTSGYSGNVTFSSYTVAATHPTPVLDLSNIPTITGSLMFDGVATEDGRPFIINASSLQSVTGGITWSNVLGLTWQGWEALGSSYSQSDTSPAVPSISFDNVSFSGTNDFDLETKLPGVVLPNFSFSFTGTSLSAITGFWNKTQAPNTQISIVIAGNKELMNVSLPGFSIANVTLAANNDGLHADFPNLGSSPKLSVSGVEAFTADALSTITYASFVGCDLATLTLPALTNVYGNLSVTGNERLANVSFPSLSAVDGGLYLNNNDQLQTLSFPSLAYAHDLWVYGPVNNITTPNLANSIANITVVRPGTFPCSSSLGSLASSAINCTTVTEAPHPSTTGGGNHSSGSGSKSGSGGLSSTAQIGIGVGIGVGVALLFLGAILIYLRKRRRSRRFRDSIAQEPYSKEQRREDTNSPPKGFRLSALVTKTEPSHTDEGGSSSNLPLNKRMNESVGAISEQATSTVSHSRSADIEEQPGTQHEREEQHEGRHELDEQQGTRHEMDARSLPDIDSCDEDEDGDARSFEEIERIHGQSA